MHIKCEKGKLIVDPPNIDVINYPLDWIQGFDRNFSPNEISNLIFKKSYKEIKEWRFFTSNSSSKKRIIFKKREYKWNHLIIDGKISGDFIEGKSFFWRGIYFPDLGKYGRLGGAQGKKIGEGRFPNLLDYPNADGSINRSLKSKNTIKQILASNINFVFPGYLFTPPSEVTLEYLYDNGLKAIFNLAGPNGGQPLPKGTIGIGPLSDLGSVWFNYPKEYVNEYHAPNEKFYLLDQLSIANNSPAVIAIQQQDEPRYTETYEERYKLIKNHTDKAVFCTFNWGSFYNSDSLIYKIKRSEIIRPIARVTDIYCSNLYIYNIDNKNEFKDFGDPKSNVWRLVDRHKAEIEELTNELGYFYNKPRWLVLQGWGKRSQYNLKDRVVPDPDFMKAQIWAAVCLGATGISIYLQHTAASEASKHRILYKDPNGIWHEGIAPEGPNADTWEAMSEAYRLIGKYEKALLKETIEVKISSNEHILTMLKQVGERFYLFTVNTYRENMDTNLDFSIFPSLRLALINSVTGLPLGSILEGEIKISYAPFEIKIFEMEKIR